MRKVVFLFVLLSFVIACSERMSYRDVELNEELMEILREVATQIPNKPDSVLFVLNEIYSENRNRLNAQTQIEIYTLIGRSYVTTRNFEKADSFFLKAFQLAKTENDISNKVRVKINMGTVATIQELQTRFQTEQKQQEIIQQQKEIYAKRTAILYLTIICALIAVLLIALYIFHRKKLQQHIQIIRQHEELSSYVRKGQQQAAEKTNDPTLSDDLSKELLTALNQLFESEKIYRDVDLNIVDVANKLGSNRSYLSKAINHYHQKNFSDYVNYYRIEEAKEMLKAQNEGKYSNYTNEYIAEKVGFGSPAQFYRAFKQIVGVTSSEYKKAVKEIMQ